MDELESQQDTVGKERSCSFHYILVLLLIGTFFPHGDVIESTFEVPRYFVFQRMTNDFLKKKKVPS